MQKLPACSNINWKEIYINLFTKFKGVNNLFQKRSVGVCIILTLITCGIYGLYWFYKLTEEINIASEDHSISPGAAKWEKICQKHNSSEECPEMTIVYCI